MIAAKLAITSRTMTGANGLTLPNSGSVSQRLFYVGSAGSLTLENLTLSGGTLDYEVAAAQGSGNSPLLHVTGATVLGGDPSGRRQIHPGKQLLPLSARPAPRIYRALRNSDLQRLRTANHLMLSCEDALERTIVNYRALRHAHNMSRTDLTA